VKRILLRILKTIGVVLLVLVVGLSIFVYAQAAAYDTSMDKVYAIAVPTNIARSAEPAVLARGKHLADSVAGCTMADCHGPDLGGGKVTDVGPIGTFAPPNVSPGGIGAAYSDGELARLIKHGVKKDGRSVRMMPAQDFCWLPDADVAAIVSYVRSLPPVDKPNTAMTVKVLGKVLDRRDMIPLDIARRIDHDHPLEAPPPSPTAEYGKLLARGCSGCHGERMSGGPIPGAPSDFPVPLNLTPHDTGLGDWTYEDFDKLLATDIRKNGKKVDPFMPTAALKNLDDTERKALWAYLRTLPPTPFGNR
jgi:mono/diheme cytochrome c family protein